MSALPNPVDSSAVVSSLANAERGLSREWRAFWRNPLAVAGVVLIGLLVLFSWVGPLFYHVSDQTTNLFLIVHPPLKGHPLGTDGVGRDELSMLMNGGQLSLLVGFAAAIVGVFVGVIYGLASAELGGWVDSVLMRFVDMTLAIPSLFVLLLLDSILTPNAFVMVFIIALTSWQGIARIVRGEVLSLRTRDYVEAARASGAGWGRVMMRHYLPNTMGPIIVYATFTVGYAILTLAGLAFLGLGLPPAVPNWGASLGDAMSYMYQNAWWLIYPPGLLIVFAELGVNFLGDAFNSAFDPRLRGAR